MDDSEEIGAGIVNLDFLATGVVVATSAAAAALPGSFGPVHAVLSALMFVVGTSAFLWAYALGVSRSRTEAVTIAGLFFLAGDTAPAHVRRNLRIALGVQLVAVVAAAAIRPFTSVAFGILAPVLGLGLMGVWGGRHATFAPRAPRKRRAAS